MLHFIKTYKNLIVTAVIVIAIIVLNAARGNFFYKYKLDAVFNGNSYSSFTYEEIAHESIDVKNKRFSSIDDNKLLLGDDQITSKYSNLIKGKRVGIVTNQTGVNSDGDSIIDVIASYKGCELRALYSPEHGLDGKAPAGQYVYSYTHPVYKIPVYSLYGDTRKPTADMLSKIDVLLFDIQDIGARSYTYISTLNYCMRAAAENGKPILVLDRPNPLGGLTVEGYVLEEKFESFVGIDKLPYTHGMTIGEIARYFNRKIGANLQVVPMKNYKRSMVFQDTGLKWIPTSPRIPSLEAAFNYSASGSNEGIGSLHEDNYFSWVGGKGIDSQKYAGMMNEAGLHGVRFEAQNLKDEGGVKIIITDFKKYNPALVSIYSLVYAHDLTGYKVPKGKSQPTMFEKIQGTDKIGEYVEAGLRPEEIIIKYTPALEDFKAERQKYLIYK